VSACSCGSTDPVDVIFRHHRQIVVHHVGDLGDIETTRRDIGSDEDRVPPVTKSFERFLALPLGAITVDMRHPEARRREGPR
jgi:hypothetical protein